MRPLKTKKQWHGLCLTSRGASGSNGFSPVNGSGDAGTCAVGVGEPAVHLQCLQPGVPGELGHGDRIFTVLAVFGEDGSRRYAARHGRGEHAGSLVRNASVSEEDNTRPPRTSARRRHAQRPTHGAPDPLRILPIRVRQKLRQILPIDVLVRPRVSRYRGLPGRRALPRSPGRRPGRPRRQGRPGADRASGLQRRSSNANTSGPVEITAARDGDLQRVPRTPTRLALGAALIERGL